MARDTVDVLTPALAATASNVGRPEGVWPGGVMSVYRITNRLSKSATRIAAEMDV